jgi:hypothetical protein
MKSIDSATTLFIQKDFEILQDFYFAAADIFHVQR